MRHVTCGSPRLCAHALASARGYSASQAQCPRLLSCQVPLRHVPTCSPAFPRSPKSTEPWGATLLRANPWQSNAIQRARRIRSESITFRHHSHSASPNRTSGLRVATSTAPQLAFRLFPRHRCPLSRRWCRVPRRTLAPPAMHRGRPAQRSYLHAVQECSRHS